MPYIVDAGETIGDSDAIIAHVTAKHRLTIDAGLTGAQRDTDHLVTRMLDDLYWVMSYSRWKDERFWPLFRAALLREHPSLTEEGLSKAQEFNFQRYHFQGIGRYAPDAAYARGLADLQVLADLIPASGYVHGSKPTSIDAGIYGFIANIYFYEIDTPLKQFVVAHDNIVRHCRAIHDAVMAKQGVAIGPTPKAPRGLVMTVTWLHRHPIRRPPPETCWRSLDRRRNLNRGQEPNAPRAPAMCMRTEETQ